MVEYIREAVFMYYGLIGDLVGSKKLSAEKRREAQEMLRAALERVNEEHKDTVAARFLITIGDECQGLMTDKADPIAAVAEITHLIRPYEIRFAIGVGEIATAIDPKAAIGADGPAYHFARRMIESMKFDHGARLRVAMEDRKKEEGLNVVLALCDRIADYRTEKQEKLCYEMLKSTLSGRKLTQTALAGMFGIGQSTVNSQLTAAGCGEHCAGMLFVRDSLAAMMRETI